MRFRGRHAAVVLTVALAACQSESTLAECEITAPQSGLTVSLTEAAMIERAKALALQIQHTPLNENCCTAFRVDTATGDLPEAMRSFGPAMRTLRRAREVGLPEYVIVRVVAADGRGTQQALWFELDPCGNQIEL